MYITVARTAEVTFPTAYTVDGKDRVLKEEKQTVLNFISMAPSADELKMCDAEAPSLGESTFAISWSWIWQALWCTLDRWKVHDVLTSSHCLHRCHLQTQPNNSQPSCYSQWAQLERNMWN